MVKTPQELRDLCHLFHRERYLLTVSRADGSTNAESAGQFVVRIAFFEDATPDDVLTGFLHATKLRVQLSVEPVAPHIPASEAAGSGAVAPSGVVDEAAASTSMGETRPLSLDEHVSSSLAWSRVHCKLFVVELRQHGWNTEHLFLEGERSRVRLLVREDAGPVSE